LDTAFHTYLRLKQGILMTSSDKNKKGVASASKAGPMNKLSVRINHWINAITAQGTLQDPRSAGFYSATIDPLDDTVLEAMYAQSGLAKTIVDRIVEDSLRKNPNFIIQSPNEEEGNEVADVTRSDVETDVLQKWSVIEKTIKAAIWGRLFGCGGIILGVDDGRDPREPLQIPLQPGSLKWIEVVDKLNLSIAQFYTENDPQIEGNQSKIGMPKIYQIVPESAYGLRSPATQIHESRFIMFPGARTSNRVKGYNDYCDLSVLQSAYETLRDIANTEQAVHSLVQGASQAIYKVRDLHEQVSQDENRILELMRLVDYSKNTGRAIILDSEGEEYGQVGAENLQGVKEFLDLSYKRLSADVRMPLTVLLGQSPAGLNATGESDSRHWFNQVESFQNDVLAPRLQMLLTAIFQSEGMMQPDDTLKITFPSLWETSEEEKVSMLKTKAETAKLLVEGNILSTQEVRSWFIDDK